MIDMTPRLMVPDPLRAQAEQFGIQVAREVVAANPAGILVASKYPAIRERCRSWAAGQRGAFPEPKKQNVGVWFTAGICLWWLAFQLGSSHSTAPWSALFMLLGAVSIFTWCNKAFNRTAGIKSPTTRRIQLDRALVEVENIAYAAALGSLGHPPPNAAGRRASP